MCVSGEAGGVWWLVGEAGGVSPLQGWQQVTPRAACCALPPEPRPACPPTAAPSRYGHVHGGVRSQHA